MLRWRRETRHGSSSMVDKRGLPWPPHAPERHLGNQHVSPPYHPSPCNGSGVSHQSLSWLRTRMFVFQLGISIVQPRHRVHFLNEFINESGKSTWFLKSRKVKVCKWVSDSLWPCFYYFFPCKFCAGFIHIFLPERVRWSQDLVCFGPAFTHPRMHRRDVTRALPCLSLNEFLTSFFFKWSKRILSSNLSPNFSFKLSPVLVVKPKHPHCLYMVVVMPLCRYIICASVHWAPPTCECASARGAPQGMRTKPGVCTCSPGAWQSLPSAVGSLRAKAWI